MHKEGWLIASSYLYTFQKRHYSSTPHSVLLWDSLFKDHHEYCITHSS